MPQTEPFEKHPNLYEEWFTQNQYTYKSDVEAAHHHLLPESRGLEVGVGGSLFAVPLFIDGIEPADKMRSRVKKCGFEMAKGIAKTLLSGDNSHDFTLMVTTACFLNNVQKSIEEAWRVIKTGGKLTFDLDDKNRTVGISHKEYQYEYVL